MQKHEATHAFRGHAYHLSKLAEFIRSLSGLISAIFRAHVHVRVPLTRAEQRLPNAEAAPVVVPGVTFRAL
jgi:hypothetical protein